MSTAAIIILVALALALALVIAVAAYSVRSEYAKRQIRTSFGPEYARAKSDYGSSRAADREPARRGRMHNSLRLEPITVNEQLRLALRRYRDFVGVILAK